MQAHEVQLITRTPVARWCGRGGTSAWTVGVAVGVVVALLLGAPTVGTTDGGDDDSRWEGLHGVCFGLRTAADALGCLDDEHDQPLIEHVCRKIEKQLKKFDCEISPPPVMCPCEGLTYRTARWDGSINTTVCLLFPDPLIQIRGSGDPQPYLQAGTLAAGQGWTCALGDTTRTGSVQTGLDITEPEFQACVQSLETIAANDNVPCQPWP